MATKGNPQKETCHAITGIVRAIVKQWELFVVVSTRNQTGHSCIAKIQIREAENTDFLIIIQIIGL